MKPVRGGVLVAIGFAMVLLGAIIPWLIVLKIIPSTLFLNFFAYTMSVGGIIVGVTGLAFSVRYQRVKDKHDALSKEPPSDDRRDW